MGEVKVLSYKYLVGAANVGWKSNSYSGSLTMHPDRHSAFDEEFRYKFFLRDVDGELKVVAQCYVGNVSFELVEPEKIHELVFDGSDDGVNAARQWVQDAYDKLMTGEN